MNRLLPGDPGGLVMEMFPLRRPLLRLVARKTWRRFREFIWDAAPIILLGSMVLGALYETGWCGSWATCWRRWSRGGCCCPRSPG